MIAIAQALSHQAKLLILDEPTSALSKQEAERLFEIIRGLKTRGLTIIYVSHRLEEVFGIADRVSALRDGHYVGTVPRDETTPEEVVRMMVGREMHLFPKEEHATGDVLLSVRGSPCQARSTMCRSTFMGARCSGWWDCRGRERARCCAPRRAISASHR